MVFDPKRLLRSLVWFTLVEHPLPWSIEQDWTFEVKAQDGTVVLKCITESDANELIALAQEVAREVETDAKKVEAILASDNPDLKRLFESVSGGSS